MRAANQAPRPVGGEPLVGREERVAVLPVPVARRELANVAVEHLPVVGRDVERDHRHSLPRRAGPNSRASSHPEVVDKELLQGVVTRDAPHHPGPSHLPPADAVVDAPWAGISRNEEDAASAAASEVLDRLPANGRRYATPPVFRVGRHHAEARQLRVRSRHAHSQRAYNPAAGAHRVDRLQVLLRLRAAELGPKVSVLFIEVSPPEREELIEHVAGHGRIDSADRVKSLLCQCAAPSMLFRVDEANLSAGRMPALPVGNLRIDSRNVNKPPSPSLLWWSGRYVTVGGVERQGRRRSSRR